MHVEILPAAGVPYRLTGSRPEEGVSAAVLTPRREQDAQSYVDADHGGSVDYGNLTHDIEFDVTREFGSAGEAAVFMLMHAEELPPTGSVRFRVTEQDGSFRGDVELENATIACTKVIWQTCAITLSYRVAGGRMKR